MKLSKIILFVFIFNLIGLTAKLNGYQTKDKPLRVNLDAIPEKMYVRYGIYDLTLKLEAYFHFVFIKENENGKHYLKIYENDFFYTSYSKDKKIKAFLPERLEDFQGLTIIDLDKIQVISEECVLSNDKLKIGNLEFMYRKEKLDISNGYFESEWGEWNGYETKVSRGRVKVDLSLPIFNFSMLVGRFPVGFLNFEESGNLQFVIPVYLKKPVLGTPKITGEESVTTPFGSFQAIKVSPYIGDFLLRLVMGRIMKDYCNYWVDKKTKITVKIRRENGLWLLDTYEEFTNWSDVAKRLNKEWVEQVCFKRLGIE